MTHLSRFTGPLVGAVVGVLLTALGLHLYADHLLTHQLAEIVAAHGSTFQQMQVGPGGVLMLRRNEVASVETPATTTTTLAPRR